MRTFFKIGRYILWFLCALVVIDIGVIIFFSFYRPQPKKADAIVVLGAAINTPELYNRSLHGLTLYREGLAPVIVLSGGRDFPRAQSEASYMSQVILSHATSTVPLILENQSHSTYDNIKNTKTILGAGKSVIIVSDDYHLARGTLMAAREGFKIAYWSSPKPFYYSKTDLLYYYGREVVALLYYIPKFIFG